jgi:hypothetical protein
MSPTLIRRLLLALVVVGLLGAVPADATYAYTIPANHHVETVSNVLIL